jgi:hypothetical protein
VSLAVGFRHAATPLHRVCRAAVGMTAVVVDGIGGGGIFCNGKGGKEGMGCGTWPCRHTVFAAGEQRTC